MSSQMATDAARERIAAARSEQKRAAARDFLKSAVMPLIEEVLVKKFCQTMDVIAEDNKRLKAREEGLVDALTELCDEIDKHEIHAAISRTSISWFKRKARKALAAHCKQGGGE